jgi:hypothetical protein
LAQEESNHLYIASIKHLSFHLPLHCAQIALFLRCPIELTQSVIDLIVRP